MFSKIALRMLIPVLCLMPASNLPQAAESTMETEAALLNILQAAYEASCKDADRVRDYYLADAEIINDGRLTTLDETINELKRSLGSLKDLTCSYRPKVRTSRIGDSISYLVVRETIRLSAHGTGEQRMEQVCTYVFLKKDGSRWKIAVDHCSSVPGETA